MIRFIKSKILIISFITSILIHIGLFAGMYVLHDPPPPYPDKTIPGVFSASLEYLHLPRDNEQEESNCKAALQDNPEDPGDNKSYVEEEQNKSETVTKSPEKQTKADLLDREPEQDVMPVNQSLQNTTIVDSDNDSIHKHEENADTLWSRNKQYERGERDNLFTGLQKKIEQHLVYPPLARKRGMEGTVTILFMIDEGGDFIQSRVSKSSGHRILDKAALELIRRVLPFPHSLGMKVEMKISIEYTLS
ncbi:MAG: energy transducer TonB [Spirochaetales bacterium]|nr:energy transducer TonB [Spirochaetales bacterium]